MPDLFFSPLLFQRNLPNEILPRKYGVRFFSVYFSTFLVCVTHDNLASVVGHVTVNVKHVTNPLEIYEPYFKNSLSDNYKKSPSTRPE